MKKYIPVLALLLTSLIYSQAKMDINNLIDRGGLLYAPNKEKPFSGSVFDMYNNGQLIMNGRYRKGLKSGKWTWWNEDGGIDSTGSYKNGLMHRKWTVWRENGKKEREAHLKNGKLDGLFTAWHENGQTSSEGTYKDGKKEGKWTYWYSNGQNRKITYKDGITLSKMATITMMVTANVRAQLDPCG